MDNGGGEVDHRFEAVVCFVASHCDALEFLQLAEEILWRSPFRRSMHKRWVHYVQTQRRQSRFYSMMSTAVVVALLIVFFIPVGTGLAAYSAYNSIRGVALDGVNNLLDVKSLLPISKSDPLAALDAGRLQQAQHKLNKAESDFLQLQQLVNRPDIQSAIGQFAPQYSNKLDMAKRLVQVAEKLVMTRYSSTLR